MLASSVAIDTKDANPSRIVSPPQPPAPLAAPVPVVDFQRQYQQIREEVLAALERVCASQHFILGEEVRQFEAQAAALCGVDHAIGCASGTDALWLALAAAGIGPGDRVLTTPFSFFATVSSILRCGARPVLADISARTFNLDPMATQKALASSKDAGPGKGVRAILAVHLYGQCADWTALDALRQEHGCLLIEDAAQAFGAAWQGKPAGSLGDLAAFSFYPTKNLSAYGDAGMVTTNDARLAERLRMLRTHGMRRRYYHDEVGWNSRLDTMQAAVLLVKLRYIEGWNQQRRERAAHYDQLFRQAGVVDAGPYPQHGVVLPFVDPHGTHVFHQYVIRVARRDALREFLAGRGIGSEIYYPVPLHMQQCLLDLGHKAGDLPESERAAHEVLALPIFPELTGEEQERVVTAIAEFLA
ncbi:MAG: DegT/DnrJ/EryC1/StrS family aminotransferase [Acidobacteriaceae bacterium]